MLEDGVEFHGLLFFAGVVDSPVDVIVEGFGGAEKVGDALCEIGGGDEVVVDVHGQAVALEAHPLGIGGVGRIFAGHTLEGVVHVDLEAGVGSGEHFVVELVPPHADVFAQYFHGFGVVAVVAGGQHMLCRVSFTLAGTHVEVVARVHRLFATGCHETA